MTAHDNMNSQQLGPYFHGTRAALKPGDTLTGGARASRGTPEDETHHVFMTRNPAQAQFYADTARMHEGETPHVYRVEPVGDVSRGNMHDWNIGGEYTTPKARVVGEEQHPYKWPPENETDARIDYSRSALRHLGTPGGSDKPRYGAQLPDSWKL